MLNYQRVLIGISENSVPLHPMVLLIIIPFLNGYFIGGIPHFQTYPIKETNFINQLLIAGWWYTYPSEEYEFVSWGYYSQYMESHKIDVPNHQPEHHHIHDIVL